MASEVSYAIGKEITMKLTKNTPLGFYPSFVCTCLYTLEGFPGSVFSVRIKLMNLKPKRGALAKSTRGAAAPCRNQL